jgi:uncharacterized protein
MAKPQLHASHPSLIAQLKRADGHLRAVIETIEAGKSCLEVAQQLQAVEKAVANAERVLTHDPAHGGRSVTLLKARPCRKRQKIESDNIHQGHDHQETEPLRMSCLRENHPERDDDNDGDYQPHDRAERKKAHGHSVTCALHVLLLSRAVSSTHALREHAMSLHLSMARNDAAQQA